MPDESKKLLPKAISYIKCGEFEAALNISNKLISINSQDAEALVTRSGSSSFQVGKSNFSCPNLK